MWRGHSIGDPLSKFKLIACQIPKSSVPILLASPPQLEHERLSRRHVAHIGHLKKFSQQSTKHKKQFTAVAPEEGCHDFDIRSEGGHHHHSHHSHHRHHHHHTANPQRVGHKPLEASLGAHTTAQKAPKYQMSWLSTIQQITCGGQAAGAGGAGAGAGAGAGVSYNLFF